MCSENQAYQVFARTILKHTLLVLRELLISKVSFWSSNPSSIIQHWLARGQWVGLSTLFFC